jgi:hypothetical protein
MKSRKPEDRVVAQLKENALAQTTSSARPAVAIGPVVFLPTSKRRRWFRELQREGMLKRL